MDKVYRKWNYETHKYDDYLVPSKYYLSTFEENMDEKVNCCQCLKEMRFGDGYTSMEVHTNMGFGYCVCEDCYDKEMERRRNDETKTNDLSS